MLQPYWAPCTGVIASGVMCEEMGLAYERIPVDMAAAEHLGANYLRLNPAGQVPAMTLDDGTVMTESAAMVLRLCDAIEHRDAFRPVMARYRG